MLVLPLENVLVHSHLPFRLFYSVLFGVAVLLRVLAGLAPQFHYCFGVEDVGDVLQLLHVPLVLLLHGLHIAVSCNF